MKDALRPDARALLDAAAGGDEPTASDAARVRARVAARIAVGAAAGATAATVTKSAAATASKGAAGVATSSLLGALASTKAVVAVVLVGGAAATGAVVMHERAPAPVDILVAPAAPAPRSAVPVASAPGAATSSDHDTPAPTSAHHTPAPTSARHDAPAPTSSDHDTAAAPKAASTSTARRADSRDDLGKARRAANGDGAPKASPASAAVAGGGAPPAEPAAVVATKPARDLVAEEASLLRSANAALAAGDGATALRRLDEHAARFPRGALIEEREAARVLALCASGRASEARTSASAFVAANPRSPFVAQVRRACATAAP